MTGGAITEDAAAFCERMGERVMGKPLDASRLRRAIPCVRSGGCARRSEASAA